ncbi:ligase-associated DNA damage response endonuclease PdeM [Chiayiivirga flava]|uniref:Calcineurin-like phosphoesterase domain-containing protein n=1 Tax=Chiayiivirga flava TaxID=659595 RepID=A0A7W8D6L8_9GAMM|nr:ligase-associated DNA damage response endonuclease PdeM [Chiayiivirga flava]MBB5207750.1 hypothetical protein [Chiayiivirga flava]
MSAVAASEPWCEFELAGETVRLHAERALFWPRERVLAIADLHLGKGQVFREAGIALPRGGTAGDLARLDALIAAFDPAQVLILGDMLHGPLPADAPWVREWAAWRMRHAARGIVLVAGNHDRAVDGRRLGLDAVVRHLEAGPFRFEHDARPVTGRYVLGGHVHPVIRLHRTGLKAQFPVLWACAGHAVLPAFSRFTGGYRIQPAREDRLWLCAPDAVVKIPAAALVDD